MIIKALTIENFKGIREPVRVEFKPITLLFGPNSAGNGRPADRDVLNFFTYSKNNS